MANEKLVKIFVAIQADERVTAEALWAKPLGDDLYELRNTPWRAYDLNFNDIARAVPDNSEEKPRMREVIKSSGHKTLRIKFQGSVGREIQDIILQSFSDSMHHVSVQQNRSLQSMLGQRVSMRRFVTSF